jgi:hypothetical protein
VKDAIGSDVVLDGIRVGDNLALASFEEHLKFVEQICEE